ncbi:hypothetical protein BC830DRAFT_733913 [Chytriomyces sp. MP71]|nr:hypothetical protein BC830DRAFT_733913 [Chytriomyces sp. MP71]
MDADELGAALASTLASASARDGVLVLAGRDASRLKCCWTTDHANSSSRLTHGTSSPSFAPCRLFNKIISTAFLAKRAFEFWARSDLVYVNKTASRSSKTEINKSHPVDLFLRHAISRGSWAGSVPPNLGYTCSILCKAANSKMYLLIRHCFDKTFSEKLESLTLST